MGQARSIITRYGNLIASFVVGLIAAAALPLDGFKEVTQELMALFGLIMAGVLPTMVLTASVLRPGNLPIKTIRDYSRALETQLAVWAGFFLISLFASLCVVVGKMCGWSLHASASLGRAGTWDFDFIRIVNGLLVAILALLLLRGAAVGRGVFSLLRLASSIAISEAEARDQLRHREAKEDLAKMPGRPGFGDYVDLPS